jgi:hypothetical protein
MVKRRLRRLALSVLELASEIAESQHVAERDT